MKLHASTLQKSTHLETFVEECFDTLSLADSENQYLRAIDLFSTVFFNPAMLPYNPSGMFTNIIVVCGLQTCCVFHTDPSLHLDKCSA